MKKKEAVENPLRDEKMLLDAIVQADSYESDYLILEVNERAIARGYVKDIPFDIRLITNIIPHHNDQFYPPEEYVRLKKSFFQNIPAEEDSICIHGIDERSIFDSMASLTNKQVKVFGSKYVCNVRGIDEQKINYLLYSPECQIDSLKGLEFPFRINSSHYDHKSNLIMPFNALNILASIAVLDSLGVYENNRFQELINNIVIPGRNELTRVNDRLILVSAHLIPELEILKTYRDRGEISNIKVVVGTSGDGYKSWIKEFPNEIYIREKTKALPFAYNYIKKYADYVYITTTDIGASNPVELVETQAQLLEGSIPYETEINRRVAIKKAIINSQKGDLIYISGRANRRILCESSDSIISHVDQEVVDEVLKEIGWTKQEEK